MVIRSFHCFKIGSYKFLVEGCPVYWLTAYVISIHPILHLHAPPPPHPPPPTPRLVKQLQLAPTPFKQSIAVSSLKAVKPPAMWGLYQAFIRVQINIMLCYSLIVYTFRTLYLKAYRVLQNFSSHVKCSVFCVFSIRYAKPRPLFI